MHGNLDSIRDLKGIGTMGFDGILFDLDNTLVDRNASLQEFAAEWMDAFGDVLEDGHEARVLAVIQESDGGGYQPRERFFAQLEKDLPWKDAPGEGEIQDFWQRVFPKCTQPANNLYEVLEALGEQALKIGIVTNGTERSQHGKIDRLGLWSYAEIVIISETVGVKKPDPAIFEAAQTELNVPASDLCFVGDHPVNDVQGSARMGMTPVWVAGHHVWPDDLEPPAWQIEYLSELIPLLEKIEGDSENG